MAYASWSVVFGEQPSAAKWNILGTNDSTFNDFMIWDRQDDTTDSTTAEPVIQYGWGQMVGDNTANIGETVTFPTAYSAAPVVLVNPVSAKATSAATAIGQFDSPPGSNTYAAFASNITTTTFVLDMTRETGSTFSSSTYFGYAWIAMGA